MPKQSSSQPKPSWSKPYQTKPIT